VRGFILVALAAVLLGCPTSPPLLDAGPADAGVLDAGVSDAGVRDAGTLRTFVYVGGTGPVQVFAPGDGGLSLVGSVNAGVNPSFLAIDEPHARLYAVNESGPNSTVTALALDPHTGLPTVLDTAVVGAGPAHVSVDRSGRWVLVSNYGGGEVVVLPVTDAGVGAVVDSQTPGQLPHQTLTDATNAFAFTPCKGSDLVQQFRFDDARGGLTLNGTLATRPGAGPRHLALWSGFAFLGNELDSTVQALSVDAGVLTSLQTLSTLPMGTVVANTVAEVVVHPSGAWLYVSNRGHDSIAQFSVDASGHLTLVGHTSTHGATPRSFAIDPTGRELLVANQGSKSLARFVLDDAGVPSFVGPQVTTVGAPAFVGYAQLRD
jgi:6-phosphogluconolactonase